jgi:hypothetical protein
LNGLIANWLDPLIRLNELQMICTLIKVIDCEMASYLINQNLSNDNDR